MARVSRSTIAASSVLLLAILLPAAAAAAPEPASDLLQSARNRAARDGRNVLVVFHASWCPWCRRMQAFLGDEHVAAIVAASYEVVWLDVLERPRTMGLENPGARQLMTGWGGSGGLPYCVVVSPEGGKLADSGTTGFPVKPEEVDAFLALVRSTAPHIDGAGMTTLANRLKRP